MPKQRTDTRLTKRDIELIVAVVDSAWRNGWTVAQTVRHRLAQNDAALSMCLEPEDSGEEGRAAQEARDAMCRLIASETRRIHRLKRRFASWQTADYAGPWSRIERTATPHHEHPYES